MYPPHSNSRHWEHSERRWLIHWDISDWIFFLIKRMLLNDFIIIVGGYFWQEMKWQFYQIKLKMGGTWYLTAHVPGFFQLSTPLFDIICHWLYNLFAIAFFRIAKMELMIKIIGFCIELYLLGFKIRSYQLAPSRIASFFIYLILLALSVDARVADEQRQ